MGPDLVEASGLRGGFNQAYLTEFRVRTCFEGFELGLGGVGAWDDGLSHIDSAGLMFAESVEGLVDQAGIWGPTMNNGEIAFLNLTALLHFTEEGGVLFASRNWRRPLVSRSSRLTRERNSSGYWSRSQSMRVKVPSGRVG